MEYCLKQIVKDDTEPLIIYLQPATDQLEIGRQSFSYLKRYSKVSRRHARLRKIKNDWFIENLDSFNGVYVNGKEVFEMRKLEIGDIVGLGYRLEKFEGFMCIFCLDLHVEQKPMEQMLNEKLNENESNGSKSATTMSEKNIIETKRNIEMSHINSSSLSMPNTTELDTCRNFIDLDSEDEKTSILDFTNSSENNLNSISAAENLKNIELQKYFTVESDKKIMKNCSISLVKCDSNYFESPSDVKIPAQFKKRIGKLSSFISKTALEYSAAKRFQLKKFSIPLVKCDSRHFQWPSDAKNYSQFKKRACKQRKRRFVKLPDKKAYSQNKSVSPVLKGSNSDYDLNSQAIFHNSSSQLLSNSDNGVFAGFAPEAISNSFQNKSTVTIIESKSPIIYSNTLNSAVSQSSSNVAIVKPMFSEKKDVYNKREKEECVGYSQEEEIIYISDNESYLDFDCSRQIKQEPLDEDDKTGIELLDELPDENDIIFERDTGIDSESVTDIQQFMQNYDNVISNIKTEPPDWNDEVLNDTENLKVDPDPIIKESQNISFGLLNSDNQNISNISIKNDNSSVPLHSVCMYPKKYENDSSKDTSSTTRNVSHSNSTNKNNVKKYSCDSKMNKSSTKSSLNKHKAMKPRQCNVQDMDECFKHIKLLKKSVDNLKQGTSNNIANDKKLSSKITMVKNKKESHQITVNKNFNLKRSCRISSTNKSKALKSEKNEKKKSETSTFPIQHLPKKFSTIERIEKYNPKSQFPINMPKQKFGIKATENKSLLNDNKNYTSKTLSSYTNSWANFNTTIQSASNDNFYSKPPAIKDKPIAVSYINHQTNKTSNLSDNISVNYHLRYPEVSQHNTALQLPKSNSSSSSQASSLNNNLFNSSYLLTNNNFNHSSKAFPLSSTTKDVEVADLYLNQEANKATSLKSNSCPGIFRHSTTMSDPRLNKNLSELSNLSKNLNNNLDYVESYKNCNSSSIQTDTIKPSTVVSSIHINKAQISHSTKISFHIMLTKILHLNTKWIEQQKRLRLPPESVCNGAVDLPLHFNSYDSYVSCFTPMLMLKIWDGIFEKAQLVLDQEVLSKFYFIVHSWEIKSGLMECKCECVINKNSPHPVEGTLLIVDLKTEGPKNLLYPVFGYISKHRVMGDFIEKNLSSSVWKRLSPFWTDRAKLYEFSIVTKIRDQSPILEDLMKGKIICSIKHKLILADALKNLQFSPICKYILQPDKKVFSVNYKHISGDRHFSTSQKTVIEGLSVELQKASDEPKIMLIQGPLGTGKTTTVVGILQNLLNENVSYLRKGVKILVLAPSSIAIDDIGCRLLDLNERSSWKETPIKLVRIGSNHNINVKMKKISLEMQANSAYKKFVIKELKKKEEVIQTVRFELKKQPCYRTEKYKEILLKQYREFEEHMYTQNINYTVQETIKEDIIKESHVILSTLGSCNQSTLLSLVQARGITFSFCIVDDASQCTEPEILEPLTALGISKLILVGDHMQLPDVGSEFALERHLNRSMFERFYLYFATSKFPSPIYMLSEQFRMHSEICSFPSRYFYDGKLKTIPLKDSELFPFAPYVVYDILDNRKSSCVTLNSDCTKVITSICSEFRQFMSRYSVGIITPYKAQVKLYKEALSHYPDIEINTIDSFQKKEKDIIIISCVHSYSVYDNMGKLSCKKRLNVAITRARKCLIVCCHANSLQGYRHWNDLIYDARQRCQFATITSPKNFPRVFSVTMNNNAYFNNNFSYFH